MHGREELPLAEEKHTIMAWKCPLRKDTEGMWKEMPAQSVAEGTAGLCVIGPVNMAHVAQTQESPWGPAASLLED